LLSLTVCGKVTLSSRGKPAARRIAMQLGISADADLYTPRASFRYRGAYFAAHCLAHRLRLFMVVDGRPRIC